MSTSLIYDLSLQELISLMTEWGEPSYRARQIWQGIYRSFWNIPEEFMNLPAELRQKMDKFMEFNLLVPKETLSSSNGKTEKTLFQLQDGKYIEAVLMKYDPSVTLQQSTHDGSGHGRRTLCISTQVGCAMGCVFCATGQMGFKRHLSSGNT